MEDQIIDEFDTKPAEKIRIIKSNFNGKEFFHIRIYSWYKGEWMPTKRGITLNYKDLFDFFAAIEKFKSFTSQ